MQMFGQTQKIHLDACLSTDIREIEVLSWTRDEYQNWDCFQLTVENEVMSVNDIGGLEWTP